MGERAEKPALFRPSRPDFIETVADWALLLKQSVHCSGLLGRTSLRHGRRLTYRDPEGRIVPAF